MKDQVPLGPGPYDSEPDNEFLIEHDAHIQAEARKALPSELFSGEVLDLEADELAQKIRIKLWTSRQKSSITYPKAYIRTIARTTAVDLVRCHRPTIPLLSGTDKELGPGDILVAQSEGFQDPSHEIESGEINSDLLAKLVVAILALPPRQKQAMLYALFESKYDALPLINALKAHGVNIEAGSCAKQEHEVHLLRASLAIARKKLQWLIAEFMED